MMNLAIEYLVRSGTAQNGLTLPCSIYISHYASNERLIITIEKSHIYKDFTVRKWKLKETESLLPPYEEVLLHDYEDLFRSDVTVLPEYKLLDYQEDPYQGSAYVNNEDKIAEHAYITATAYCGNTTKHKKHRRQWLWERFCEAFENVSQSDERWSYWRSYFDIERNQGFIAPELAFKSAYHEKNNKFQKRIITLTGTEEMPSTKTIMMNIWSQQRY